MWTCRPRSSAAGREAPPSGSRASREATPPTPPSTFPWIACWPTPTRERGATACTSRPAREPTSPTDTARAWTCCCTSPASTGSPGSCPSASRRPAVAGPGFTSTTWPGSSGPRSSARGTSWFGAASKILVMGKLHGLCIGLDVCSTLHMDVSLDDLDFCQEAVAPARPAYLMALPTKIDPMLGYLTTGFQDHVRLREKHGLRVDDRMWAFFQRLGIIGADGKPTARFGDPCWIYLQYRQRKGDARPEAEIRAEGARQMEAVRRRGVHLAEGHGAKRYDSRARPREGGPPHLRPGQAQHLGGVRRRVPVLDDRRHLPRHPLGRPERLHPPPDHRRGARRAGDRLRAGPAQAVRRSVRRPGRGLGRPQRALDHEPGPVRAVPADPAGGPGPRRAQGRARRSGGDERPRPRRLPHRRGSSSAAFPGAARSCTSSASGPEPGTTPSRST